MRLLLIDNYDSYTYNLYQLLSRLCGSQVTVLVNDDPALSTLDSSSVDAVVISPGPGRPQHATDLGWCWDLLAAHPRLPVLGVCLGHQALAYAAGARVVETAPRHGKLSRIRHDGRGLFDGLPQGFEVTRYHSLRVAEPLPDVLEATAWAEDGVVMAMRHRQLPRWGVQFHPESVATSFGLEIVTNFINLAGTGRAAAGPGPAPASHTARAVARAAQAEQLRVSVRRLDASIDTWQFFSEMYAGQPDAFWLDSSQAGPGRGRFSFLGDSSGPMSEVLTYRVGTGAVEVRRGTTVSTERGTIFEVLESRLRGRRTSAGHLPFDLAGGYVGYFGYELKAECGGNGWRSSPTPDAYWLFADRLVAVDHQRGHTYVLAVHPPAEPAATAALDWINATVSRLRHLAPAAAPGPAADPKSEEPAELLAAGARLARSRGQYVADIRRCMAELRRGESYEICLTNRVYLPPMGDPLAFYGTLRRINPAPYAALLTVGEHTVLSSSPERFLRVYRDGGVEAKPIKGTAPRSPDPEVDEALRSSLAASPKTRAENLMIVDLLRNDLGQVCEVGSIEVPSYMATESYATVHQLVSTIRGRLRAGISAVGCARACFPGGSMTGAPKIRTMEIIDRLEGTARGVYSGALGYFGLNGGADLSIVIRTAVAGPDGVMIGTGGAIVMDSDPDEEFAEIAVKAQALLRAYRLSMRSRPVAGQ